MGTGMNAYGMELEGSRRKLSLLVYFYMRLSLPAQARNGYEDIRYEELYIGDCDNDK